MSENKGKNEEKNLNECKENYLKAVFDHNQGLIELADNKANIILGIITVLIPVVFGVDFFVSSNQTHVPIIIFQVVTFFAGAVLLLLTFSLSIMVIKARTGENYQDMIFFKNIISNEFEDYKKKVAQMGDKEIHEDYLKEIFALAKINDKKYTYFKKALLLLVVSVGFLVIRYILYYFFVLTLLPVI